MNNIYNIAKIYLSCKRGMLELDLILLTFMEYGYLKLSDKMKYDFLNLLNESDQQLYSLLIGTKKTKIFYKIIKKIKNINKLSKYN